MERYVIYELQMSEDGAVAHLPPINVHTVMLCTATGRLLDSKSYMHKEEVENV